MEHKFTLSYVGDDRYRVIQDEYNPDVKIQFRVGKYYEQHRIIIADGCTYSQEKAQTIISDMTRWGIETHRDVLLGKLKSVRNVQNAIHNARVELGLTVEDVALRAGCLPKRVEDVERGFLGRIPFPNIERIANAVGLELTCQQKQDE